MQNITSNHSSIGHSHEHDPAMDFLDMALRMANLLAQIFYFVAVIFLKDLQCLPQVPMHHTNAIGLINAIHYCFWIQADEPNFSSTFLNDFFCTLSEVLWAVTKYARAYSILTVAVFRYIGVTRLTLYKKITSVKIIILSILINWLIAAVIFLVSKFSAKTTHGTIYCYDGYSSNREQNLLYFFLTSSFGYALPLILVTVFYALIQIKLVKLSKHLNQVEHNSRMKVSALEAEDSTCHREMKKEEHKSHVKMHKKEKKLAHQFIVINGLEFCSMTTKCNQELKA
ncbi:hypothetical protein BpHYR1_037189 [Brachionus plicatilis]|uniref:G-protein coupled receptors family 1 profile domain-containing protein n=1 Tax=Brachionus plicatilis TaxID=10195 RepID=A0A3M7SI37_BRAPC|nr:hypothetical protein BpHYR1_037189 [Brachionus plicatilis]